MTLSCYHSTDHTPSVSPFGLPAPPLGSQVQPPLKGLAGVAVLDGVQLLNAKLRTAHRAGGVSCGTQNTIMETQGEFVQSLAAPLGGSAAKRQRGWALVTLSCYHSTSHTPSVSPFGLPAPPPGSQVQPPLKGLAGVAVLDGVQLLNAKLRTAQQRRRGFRRYAEYHYGNPRRIRRGFLGSPNGGAGRPKGPD